MSETEFRPVPPEPAHPMVVKLHDDLVAIYTHIRDKYQVGIDQAFDRVSREVGFVVATALPFTFEVGDGRVKGGIIVDGLQGTLFDRELATALKQFYDDPLPITVSAGTYNLYLFWFEALKLRLHTEWVEPAHFRPARSREPAHVLSEVRGPARSKPCPWEEPAHWFDPGTLIAVEERVLISVIDEVYPELRLADRIASQREASRRQVLPEAIEPAHFRRVEPGVRPESPEELLKRIRIMLDWV